jgi:hypothetical protein
MSATIDRDTVKMWREHGEEAIQDIRAIAQRSYEQRREKLAARFREQLDKAAQQRYLILPRSQAQYVQDVEVAYYDWCRANLQPLLIIKHTANEHTCKIEFYLSETVTPHGIWNIWCPDLDDQDERFHLLMLLCNEWSLTEGHVDLHQVPTRNVDEVARELLAFYDRMYEQLRRVIEPMLAEYDERG